MDSHHFLGKQNRRIANLSLPFTILLYWQSVGSANTLAIVEKFTHERTCRRTDSRLPTLTSAAAAAAAAIQFSIRDNERQKRNECLAVRGTEVASKHITLESCESLESWIWRVRGRPLVAKWWERKTKHSRCYPQSALFEKQFPLFLNFIIARNVNDALHSTNVCLTGLASRLFGWTKEINLRMKTNSGTFLASFIIFAFESRLECFDLELSSSLGTICSSRCYNMSSPIYSDCTPECNANRKIPSFFPHFVSINRIKK